MAAKRTATAKRGTSGRTMGGSSFRECPEDPQAGATERLPGDGITAIPNGQRKFSYTARMSFVSHVECTVCGHRHDPKRTLSVCERCGQMLAVRYDLAPVKPAVSKEALRQRPPGMYLFAELTPLDDGP